MPAIAVNSFFPTIFLGLFVLVGGAVAGFGLRTVWRDHASATWPLASGQITRSEVITDSSGEGTSYKPGVEYRYSVNGKEFTGKRVSFGTDGGTGSGTAYQAVHRYPVGKGVHVRYRSDHPELSVLETGITKHSFVRVAFGLGFAGFALWFRLIMWLAAPRNGRRCRSRRACGPIGRTRRALHPLEHEDGLGRPPYLGWISRAASCNMASRSSGGNGLSRWRR